MAATAHLTMVAPDNEMRTVQSAPGGPHPVSTGQVA